jgi:hypothetical protein
LTDPTAVFSMLSLPGVTMAFVAAMVPATAAEAAHHLEHDPDPTPSTTRPSNRESPDSEALPNRGHGE